MSRPNLLFIWSDEHRPDTLSSYGNPQTNTPNLDRLASQSTVFDNCFCCSPVCTPSRGSILSGLWPHQHGALQNNVPMNADCKTIAEMMGDASDCTYLGKWHLGDEIFAQHGWEKFVSLEDLYIPHYSAERDRTERSDYHHFLQEHGFPADSKRETGRVYSRGYTAVMAERYTKARWLGQRTAEEIRSKGTAQKPWTMSVNFLEPHMPFYGPLNDHYDPDALDVSPIFGKQPEGPLPESYQNQAKKNGNCLYHTGELTSESEWRRMLANYYGLVELVDQAVGDILQALEESGQANNTLIVYTSDHGEMMGSHNMVGKSVMYQQSVQVPLMIHTPGQTESHRISGNFSHIDLAPTLLEALGHEVPNHLRGTSRASLLNGGAMPEEDVFLFWHPQNPELEGNVNGQSWRCIVAPDGWKYAISPQEEIGLLFNLNDDPWEQHNRFTDPEAETVRAHLHQRLFEWIAQEEDPFFLS